MPSLPVELAQRKATQTHTLRLELLMQRFGREVFYWLATEIIIIPIAEEALSITVPAHSVNPHSLDRSNGYVPADEKRWMCGLSS